MSQLHERDLRSDSADTLLSELKIDRSLKPSSVRPSHRVRWIFILVLIAGILGLAAWRIWRVPVKIPVQVGTVVARSATGGSGTVLDASGYVVARRTATVSAQITGIVTEVLFEEGDFVEAGQVLARLNSQSASASLEAAVRQAAAAEQLVRQYEVQLAQAKRDSTRSQELAQSHMVSRQTAEQAIAQADELDAQLLSQRRTLEAARAQAQVAKVNLGYAVVRAPFSGVITSKAAQVGEIISPSAASGYTRTGVATIVDMNSLEVEVDVGEAYIGRVKPGMAADITLNAYPELKIPANVLAIIPTADRAKATVKVRVGLKQRDARIVPEMGARVSFMAKDGAQADTGGVRMPVSALSRRMDQDVAFVVQAGGIAQRRVLKIGSVIGSEREVFMGLHAGERVVLNPPAGLEDGMRVSLGGD